MGLARYEMHEIAVVVDRLVLRDGLQRRLTDSVETVMALVEGVTQIQIVGGSRRTWPVGVWRLRRNGVYRYPIGFYAGKL